MPTPPRPELNNNGQSRLAARPPIPITTFHRAAPSAFQTRRPRPGLAGTRIRRDQVSRFPARLSASYVVARTDASPLARTGPATAWNRSSTRHPARHRRWRMVLRADSARDQPTPGQIARRDNLRRHFAIQLAWVFYARAAGTPDCMWPAQRQQLPGPLAINHFGVAARLQKKKRSVIGRSCPTATNGPRSVSLGTLPVAGLGRSGDLGIKRWPNPDRRRLLGETADGQRHPAVM